MNRFEGAGPKPGNSILDRLDTDMAKVFATPVYSGPAPDAPQPMDEELPWDGMGSEPQP